MVWFQIGTQTPSGGKEPPPSTSLVSGALVYLYNDAGVQIGPVDGGMGFAPTETPRRNPDRTAEFMVEVLYDHSTANDCVIRLIPTGLMRYLKWPHGLGGVETEIRTDPDVDPLNRGKADLDIGYELTIRPFAEDPNRFYALTTGSDGTQYYLQSGRIGNLWTFYSTVATSSPPARTTPNLDPDDPGSEGFVVWYMEIISTSVQDTMTSHRTVGSMQKIPSSERLEPSESAVWNPQNPTDEPQEGVGGGQYEFSVETSTSSTFHWDVTVNVTEEAGFDVGVASGKVTVSVGSDIGGETKHGEVTTRKLSADVPPTTVAPHCERQLQVELELVDYGQDFEMTLQRVVKQQWQPEADTYHLNVLGGVTFPGIPTLEGLTWGPNTPLADDKTP